MAVAIPARLVKVMQGAKKLQKVLAVSKNLRTFAGDQTISLWIEVTVRARTWKSSRS